MVVTRALACVARQLNVFECVGMMTRMFVLCMLVCSAANALVVAEGCCWNIRVHFAAARVAKKLCNVGLLSSYFQCFNYILYCPSTPFHLLM